MAMQSGFIKRIRDIMRMDAGINGDAQRIEQMVWMLFLKVYDAKEDDWELNEDNYESIIPEDLRWRNWAKADENGHAMTGDKLLSFVNNTLFPVLKGNDVKESEKVLYEGIQVTPDTPIKKAIVKSTFEDANNYMKDGVYLRQVIDVIDEIEFDDVKESHDFGFVYEEILRELQSAGSSGEFYTPRAVTEFMALMIKPQLGEKMADFACGTGGFITSWLGQLSKQVTDTTAQKQLDDSIYGIEKKPFPYLLCVTNMLLHDIEVPNIYHMNSLKHNLLDYTDDDKFDVILMNPPYGGHEDKSIQNFFPDDLTSSETADLFMSVIMYRLKKVVVRRLFFQMDSCLERIMRRWQSRKSCSQNVMYILSFVCRTAFLRLIHPSQPIFCSLTVLARQQKRGSIVWICQRAIKTSQKPSRCSLFILTPLYSGGITEKKLRLTGLTRRRNLQSKNYLTEHTTLISADILTRKKKFCRLRN